MNCREFENEFTDRAGLSDAATLHLRDCRDCQKLKTELTHLWRMFESLPSVNAPADFNFRLKGRLTATGAADVRPAWWKSPRFAAPVSAFVLLAFLVFAAQNFFVSNPETAGVVVENPPASVVTENQANPPEIAIARNSASPETESNAPETIQSDTNIKKEPSIPPTFVAEKTARHNIAPPIVGNSRRKPSAINESDEPAGSTTSSVRTARVFTPKGIPPMQSEKIETSPDLINGKKISAVEILKTIGIEIETDQMPPRVKNVAAKSIAESSDIQTGDVIEAIDDVLLDKNSDKSKNAPAFNGIKSLKINRAGKIIELTLKPDFK